MWQGRRNIKSLLMVIINTIHFKQRYLILMLWIQCLMLVTICRATMTTELKFCDVSTPGLKEYLPHETECPELKDRFLTNIQVPWGVAGRAWYTIPTEISIETSHIPNIGYGAIARTFIQAHTWLGEYQGRILTKDTGYSAYTWTSKCNNIQTHLVDAADISTSNWPRWVNCARNPQERNVITLLCYGRVYYMSIKPIYPRQELLVYYGQDYASHLGINVTLFIDDNDVDELEDGLDDVDDLLDYDELGIDLLDDDSDDNKHSYDDDEEYGSENDVTSLDDDVDHFDDDDDE